MSATWIKTTRRLLPRLARVSREIRPTAHLHSVADLSPDLLRKRGIETVLWDVDGTLMSLHAGGVDPEIAPAFDALTTAPGLDHAIVSNCEADRFLELASIFPLIPIFLGYETEEGPAYHVRHGLEERWIGPGAARARADKRPHPLRKPSGRLVAAALEELGAGERRDTVLLVGDQYFTDIASANRAGVRSIKVSTVGRSTFPLPVRISQRLEAAWYRLRYGRPEAGWST